MKYKKPKPNQPRFVVEVKDRETNETSSYESNCLNVAVYDNIRPITHDYAASEYMNGPVRMIITMPDLLISKILTKKGKKNGKQVDKRAKKSRKRSKS